MSVYIGLGRGDLPWLANKKNRIDMNAKVSVVRLESIDGIAREFEVEHAERLLRAFPHLWSIVGDEWVMSEGRLKPAVKKSKKKTETK